LLAAIPAAAAGHSLYDLDLFAVLFDHMADVDGAVVAGVGALEASVVGLYCVVVILGGWVRGCARLFVDHGIPPWSRPFGWLLGRLTRGAVSFVCTVIVS
jgi:hypothetical protein